MLQRNQNSRQELFTQTIKHGPFLLQIEGSQDFIREIKILKNSNSKKRNSAYKPKWYTSLIKHLDLHLNAEQKSIENLPLDFSQLTDFQRATILTLQQIPYGKTWSYKELAAKINKPKASRAVGSAIAKNPFLILLPCHRVLLSGNKIGQFSGGSGTKTKAELIDFEQKCLSKKH